MKNTYLIQRLEKPYGHINPFSFGGGYVNGGMSKEASEILKNIMSFDYMGAAEYEFGSLPKSLDNIAKSKNEYVSFSKEYNGKVPVYVICHSVMVEEIKRMLSELAKGKIQTKGFTNFRAAIGMDSFLTKEKCKTVGWLELNNDFFFFTDKKMFENVSALFEIKPL